MTLKLSKKWKRFFGLWAAVFISLIMLGICTIMVTSLFDTIDQRNALCVRDVNAQCVEDFGQYQVEYGKHNAPSFDGRMIGEDGTWTDVNGLSVCLVEAMGCKDGIPPSPLTWGNTQ